MLNQSELRDEQTASSGKNDFNIYVNEILPAQTHKVLRDSEKILRPAGVKYIWTRNVSVYARVNHQFLSSEICTAADIEKITFFSNI